MSNPYIIKESDFTIPEGWEEVSREELHNRANGGGAPVPPIPTDRFASGAISSMTLGLATDIEASQMRGNVPSYRLQPPQPSSIAAANAGTSSFTGPLAAVAANAQAAANQAQSTANQALSATWQGAFSSIVTYAIGAIVESGGVVYVSLVNQNIGNTPASSPTKWMATGADTFLGAWNSGTAYVIGDIVSVASALYIAVANSTNQNPTTTSGFWSLITGNSVYEGAWSSLTAYSPGQTVSYLVDGNFYICIVANTNVAPAPTGSTDWVLLGTSNTLIGAWSNSTAYIAGNQVTNGSPSFIFQALVANTNVSPPTPPATNSTWLAVAPASIDPSTSYFKSLGSVPLTQNTGLSYTSTTSSIDLIWQSLALYRSDGSLVSIGSSSQNVTGLGSGRTFGAFPFYDEPTQTFKFLQNSDLTFPTLLGIAFTGNAGAAEFTTTTSAALPAAWSVSCWMMVGSGSSTSGGWTRNTAQTGTVSSVNSVSGMSWSAGLITAFYRDSGGTVHSLTSTQTYNDGLWHHCAYVCNPASSQQFLYVDGVQVASGTVATAVSATSAYIRIAKDAANIIITGDITELAFFNKALLATDVAAEFNAANSISQTAYENVVSSQSPTIWWKMGEASGNLSDSGSIGSNTANVVNSPSYRQSLAILAAIGSPAILWPASSLLLSQAQALQSRVPFTLGPWQVSTTSGGTGGGTNGGSSGGNGSGCFSGNTLVQTPNGNTPIEQLKAGDFIIAKGGVVRKVLAVLKHEAETRTMFDMGNGEFVTGKHIVFCGKWQPAGAVFANRPLVCYDREVFNLSVDGGNDFDAHSFTLASGLVCHNGKIS